MTRTALTLVERVRIFTLLSLLVTIAPELERMFFAEKRLVIESKKRAVEAAPSLMP